VAVTAVGAQERARRGRVRRRQRDLKVWRAPGETEEEGEEDGLMARAMRAGLIWVDSERLIWASDPMPVCLRNTVGGCDWALLAAGCSKEDDL